VPPPDRRRSRPGWPSRDPATGTPWARPRGQRPRSPPSAEPACPRSRASTCRRRPSGSGASRGLGHPPSDGWRRWPGRASSTPPTDGWPSRKRATCPTRCRGPRRPRRVPWPTPARQRCCPGRSAQTPRRAPGPGPPGRAPVPPARSGGPLERCRAPPCRQGAPGNARGSRVASCSVSGHVAPPRPTATCRGARPAPDACPGPNTRPRQPRHRTRPGTPRTRGAPGLHHRSAGRWTSRWQRPCSLADAARPVGGPPVGRCARPGSAPAHPRSCATAPRPPALGRAASRRHDDRRARPRPPPRAPTAAHALPPHAWPGVSRSRSRAAVRGSPPHRATPAEGAQRHARHGPAAARARSPHT